MFQGLVFFLPGSIDAKHPFIAKFRVHLVLDSFSSTTIYADILDLLKMKKKTKSESTTKLEMFLFLS